MRTDIAIDLGTDTTRIFKNKRIALSKPSAVAIDNIRGVGVVYGSDARAMIGRTGDRISAVSPNLVISQITRQLSHPLFSSSMNSAACNSICSPVIW